jgi:6-phosphogluconolactonase
MNAIQIVADPNELAEAAAQLAIADLKAAIGTHGSVTWILTGGTTPVRAYRILADRGSDVDWSVIRVGMGDERCVPVNHSDSNWGQASVLLDRVPIPEAGRLRLRGEIPGEKAACEYEALLRTLPASLTHVPRLDLIWLGVGEDGHCLSLFPDCPELEVADQLVVAVHGSPKPPSNRVSLTLSALSGAVRCTVLAAGSSKAHVVARALTGDQNLPIARAVTTITKVAGGSVTWLIDAAAAMDVSSTAKS